ncbi:hypothetical protein [Lutibacter citreus]|uniref:hypothetical protein n=1 Tax=Lutibacter citreus TaxID=2138210 RepID=UPI000DBE1C76|nr:hypothetical protein [Lutibacter citreus]
MNKILVTLTICLFTLIVKSQNTSVEKSIFGVQTGFLGIWVHNESKLSNQFALRSEVGFDTGVFENNIYDKAGFILVPTITLEPRWYYNLKKRENKSKRIDGNSGNFIALKTTYHPDWFIISNEDNINFISDISIIPTWGIRRNIGNHLNFETGFGIGYVHYFEEHNFILIDDSDVTINLHLRIGYRF